MNESLLPYIYNKVVILPQTSPAFIAAHVMAERDIACVMINNESSKILGIITDRDLTCLSLSGKYRKETPIKEFIRHKLISADTSSSIEDVIALMSIHGIRKIPVISKLPKNKERCLGIITLDDLILSGEVDIYQARDIIKKQIKRRNDSYINSKYLKKLEKCEQKSDVFYKKVSDFMSLQNKLSKIEIKKLIDYILSQLIQRMTMESANNFICQLPLFLQENFYDLPIGPDKSITNLKILSGIVKIFRIRVTAADDALKGFWLGLENFLDFNMINHLLNCMPKDIRKYASCARLGIDNTNSIKVPATQGTLLE